MASRHLLDVVAEFVQRCLAVDEGVARALAQFHQEGLVSSQALGAGVEGLGWLSQQDLVQAENRKTEKHYTCEQELQGSSL